MSYCTHFFSQNKFFEAFQNDVFEPTNAQIYFDKKWWRWRELNPRPVMALRQHLHVCFAYNAYRHATSPADGRYCDYSTIQNLVKCQWTNSFDQGAVVAASP